MSVLLSTAFSAAMVFLVTVVVVALVFYGVFWGGGEERG